MRVFWYSRDTTCTFFCNECVYLGVGMGYYKFKRRVLYFERRAIDQNYNRLPT